MPLLRPRQKTVVLPDLPEQPIKDGYFLTAFNRGINRKCGGRDWFSPSELTSHERDVNFLHQAYGVVP
jgi:hypothetical protein